jgi:C4-dicarboxylate transporter DctQ subunit
MNSKIARAARIAENLIGCLVIAAICLVTYGVISRMLNIPVAWTDELLRAVFLWLIFIAAAAAYKTDNLIGFDLLDDLLAKRRALRKTLKLIQCAGALVFGIFMTVKMSVIISTQFSTGEFTPVLNLPLWFINSGCFIGGGVLTTVFAAWKLIRLLGFFEQEQGRDRRREKGNTA